MKKILFMLLLVTTAMNGQTSTGNEAEFDYGIKNNASQTVTNSSFITTTGADGTQGKILGENISLSVIPPVHHFTPITTSIKGYFQGVDDALGDIVATTAGITTRLWLTADQTTITAGTFYKTNFVNKGIVASAIQSVTNNDNEKKYFAQDIIGDAYVTVTTFPKGIYAGNLSVSTSPNSAQQRFTVEVYKCNTNGTPIASGISGAVTGSLGVTVITILDSGLLTLADGSVTNVPVSNTIDFSFTINVGERVRYHISAEKVGTTGANITESLYLGTSYNSYIDVPVPLNTSAVQNLSNVAGSTTTDALNNLDASVVHKTGNLTESIDGNKTFLSDINIKGTYIRVAPAFTDISGILPLYTGNTPETARSATFYINSPITLANTAGWHTYGAYSTITQSNTGASHASFDSRDVFTGVNGWNHAIGFQSRNVLEGSGTMSIASGFTANFTNNSSGTVGEVTGFKVNTFDGTGMYTNKYGLKVDNNGTGDNEYSIYTGNSKVYIGGKTGLNTTAPLGVLDIFTGLTGVTTTVDLLPNGTISFINGGSSVASPIILSKSNNATGLTLISGTNDGNTSGDITFNIRENNNTDFSTLTTTAFRFSRFGTNLVDILRNGNTTFIGTVKAAPATLSAELVTLGQIGVIPKKYVALLNQSGTSAPTATVVENTLGGTLVWTRNSTGNYYATLTGAFPDANKVICFTGGSISGVLPLEIVRTQHLNSNTVQIFTQQATDGAFVDGSLVQTTIEIRVYN